MHIINIYVVYLKYLAHCKHYVNVRCYYYFMCRIAVQILTTLGIVFIKCHLPVVCRKSHEARVIVFICSLAHTYTHFLRYSQVLSWCVLVFIHLCVFLEYHHLIHFLHRSSISPIETSWHWSQGWGEKLKVPNADRNEKVFLSWALPVRGAPHLVFFPRG